MDCSKQSPRHGIYQTHQFPKCLWYSIVIDDLLCAPRPLLFRLSTSSSCVVAQFGLKLDYMSFIPYLTLPR